MPVYKCAIPGEDTVRLVRAKSIASARRHLVPDVDTVNPDDMADLLGQGVKLETAVEAPEPANPGSEK